MYALIENGGQQHKVSPGDTITVQKISYGDSGEISLGKVLMVAQDENITVGKPYVENASVRAQVIGDRKGSKVLVYKKKPRKGYKKLNGHRQNYTVLKIQDIVFGG